MLRRAFTHRLTLCAMSRRRSPVIGSSAPLPSELVGSLTRTLSIRLCHSAGIELLRIPCVSPWNKRTRYRNCKSQVVIKYRTLRRRNVVALGRPSQSWGFDKIRKMGMITGTNVCFCFNQKHFQFPTPIIRSLMNATQTCKSSTSFRPSTHHA